MRCLEELGMRPKGSDHEDSDEGMELDLDDESRALLDFSECSSEDSCEEPVPDAARASLARGALYA